MENVNNIRGLELSEIALYYQNTREDKYFEELWRRVKPFAIGRGSKYRNTISLEDMEEIAMICLYDCCRCLKEGTNVLTYYGRILINRYHDFYKKPLKRGNDILNNSALSLDTEYSDEYYNRMAIFEPYTLDDHFSKEDFYEECKLLDDEIILVDLLECGYKQTEILEKLKMEKKEYKKTIKSIRNKVLQNYEMGTI